MPRRRTGPQPRKPYQRRVDLVPYQRLMRFLRWMSPDLTSTNVLRMLPQSDQWTSDQFQRYAADLDRHVANTGSTSRPALVPWIVIGKQGWPTKSQVIHGTTVYYQQDPDRGVLRMVRPPGLPQVQLSQAGLPGSGLDEGEPVLLEGQFPSVEGLCQLAAELRDLLEDLTDTDSLRTHQRWGAMLPFFPDLSTNGEVRALMQLRRWIAGRITLSIALSCELSPGHVDTARTSWRIEERVQDCDFAAYCAWLLVQLIRDGHAWRVTRCTSCQAWFLRVRRERQAHPRHFCSDACRRAYHNPRRGKGANNSRPRKR